jgi:hypothetical protein
MNPIINLHLPFIAVASAIVPRAATVVPVAPTVTTQSVGGAAVITTLTSRPWALESDSQYMTQQQAGSKQKVEILQQNRSSHLGYFLLGSHCRSSCLRISKSVKFSSCSVEGIRTIDLAARALPAFEKRAFSLGSSMHSSQGCSREEGKDKWSREPHGVSELELGSLFGDGKVKLWNGVLDYRVFIRQSCPMSMRELFPKHGEVWCEQLTSPSYVIKQYSICCRSFHPGGAKETNFAQGPAKPAHVRSFFCRSSETKPSPGCRVERSPVAIRTAIYISGQ